MMNMENETGVDHMMDGVDGMFEGDMKEEPRPVIVCLCGSTRYKDAFVAANRVETLMGKIVLSVGMFGHDEGIDMDGPLKEELDRLHFQKIRLADEILVLNVGGYVGHSTNREVAYAKLKGKTIRYLEAITNRTLEDYEAHLKRLPVDATAEATTMEELARIILPADATQAEIDDTVAAGRVFARIKVSDADRAKYDAELAAMGESE